MDDDLIMEGRGPKIYTCEDCGFATDDKNEMEDGKCPHCGGKMVSDPEDTRKKAFDPDMVHLVADGPEEDID